MKIIKISEDLLSKITDFKIGVVSFSATIINHEDLKSLINNIEQKIREKYALNEVLMIPNIKAARTGYKLLGKDPSRYRLAVESLFRRIVKGNSLYQINNLVDLGNILSLKTMRSVAVLDGDQIKGNILVRIGKNEKYEGIGRGNLNIEKIPVYCDDLGPFGSPTSDTKRTMVTVNTKNILLFIISFNGELGLQEDINYCIELYQQYANGNNFETMII